jgi:hypothetical protein
VKTIKFEILKLNFGQGKWFSAEYYVNGELRLGEGCHYSLKNRVAEIENKFKALARGES